MGQGPRVIYADRSQLQWDLLDLDGLLEPDHLARVVWWFVESLDLSPLYDRIKARDAVAGRPTPDPRVSLALWLYGALDGVGSARQLARLCEGHVAYRWLRGGVPVNYHGLSDFRTQDVALLDRVLSESVAVLAAEGLVDLEELAVDGTKLRAAAAKGSYRSGRGLEAWQRSAEARIEALKAELEEDPGAGERRKRAAQERARASVRERAAAAKAKLAELQAEKGERQKTHEAEEQAKGEPLVSSSDPEARIMKMADGSWQPAYNLLLATAPRAMVIVGLAATDRRNDSGLALPMVEQVEERFGVRPRRLLVDSTMATREDIVGLAEDEARPVVVYTPVPADRDDIKPDSLRKRNWQRRKEPAALKAWRARMASAAGEGVYGRRRLIETVNGQLKRCGLGRLRLRGLDKMRCEALLYAIAHNIRRGHILRTAIA